MHMNEWVARWWLHLPEQARAEFNQIVRPQDFVERSPSKKSEAAVQADARVVASAEFGASLMRNNSGVATVIDEKTGQTRHVRFGLGNDSAKLNKKMKSADLIGPTPVTITPEHVGRTLGVFTAVETKKPGWHLTDGDEHAQAQNNFLTAIQVFGGYAGFAQSADDVRRILKGN